MEPLHSTTELFKLKMDIKLQIRRFMDAGNSKECSADQFKIAI